MGNHNKSKPTGTIHLKATPKPMDSAANVADVADSTILELGTERTTSAQDTTGATTDANAEAIVADVTINTSPTGDAANNLIFKNESVPSPAGTVPGAALEDTAAASLPVAVEKVETVADTKTKMEVATEIYKRLKKVKGITRKEIIDQFVIEAKLSKAGASTYYQLIKARAE